MAGKLWIPTEEELKHLIEMKEYKVLHKWMEEVVKNFGQNGILDTTNFDNNLSAVDDTPLKAFETLDDLVIPNSRAIIKAWIKCDNANPVTIYDSYNVSSVSYVSTTRIRVYWDIDFSGVDYVTVAMTAALGSFANHSGYAADNRTFVANVAPTMWFIIAIGDQ